jgi:hypothetical protein
MIEPTALSSSPATLVMTLEPGQKITLELSQDDVLNARGQSDNKIQLKLEQEISRESIFTIPAIYSSSTNLGI